MFEALFALGRTSTSASLANSLCDSLFVNESTVLLLLVFRRSGSVNSCFSSRCYSACCWMLPVHGSRSASGSKICSSSWARRQSRRLCCHSLPSPALWPMARWALHVCGGSNSWPCLLQQPVRSWVRQGGLRHNTRSPPGSPSLQARRRDRRACNSPTTWRSSRSS